MSFKGLVLGVFEKEEEEGSLHLTEAAARFDQSLSGKLSELLKMLVHVIILYSYNSSIPTKWYVMTGIQVDNIIN